MDTTPNKQSPALSLSRFLSAGEVNAEGEMSIPTLAAAIIDVATAHANSLGIGNPAMSHLGCGWVLSRFAIEMTRYPRVNENYTLTTWIESYNRHFSERIIEIKDDAEGICGYARTIWMVLDYTTHESVGLSHLHIPEEMVMPGRCPISRQGKHTTVLPPDFAGQPGRGDVTASSEPFVYRFKYCDLDFYRHVNTVRYIELLLNRFTLEDFDTTYVKRMEIAFMHESAYGQEIQVLRADSRLTTHFTIADADTGLPCVSATLTRSSRENI